MTDMLKKSGKNNTSDAYVKSDNLTEQWKKGELTDGEYYVRTVDGIILIDCYADYWDFIQDEQIEGILCEVPSYELWKAVHEQWKVLLEENTKLKKQLDHVTKTQAKQFRDNQKLQVKAEHAKDVVNIDTARQIKQLKELLKECGEYLMCIDRNPQLVEQIIKLLGEE